MPKTIVWLASYPKSGNTWVRLFLLNYLFNHDKPAPINQAHRIGPSDASAGLYRKVATGPLVDLNDPDVVLGLRGRVLDAYASGGADVNFMKTHNANSIVRGTAMIPAEVTRGAIYILRNPLDMAVSYADHYGLTHDQTALSLGHDDAATLADATVVHQYLGNWSKHVASWVNARGFKTLAVRYEDIAADPPKAFGKILKAIGAPVDPQRLARAIAFSSFDEAQKQEAEHGFVETGAKAKRFFRSGKVGSGRETLSQSAIDTIIADHGPMMRKYGYLE